jgi:AraC family transcriptional regulator of adaptative response/methylated-DNA-[protein]-cysteine methyltransferase
MQAAAKITECPELVARPLSFAERSLCVSHVPATGLRRQTELAPAYSRLTLRQRGVDTAPISMRYGIASSWFGDCLLAWTDEGICWLNPRPCPESVSELQRHWMPAALTHDPAAAARFGAQLADTDAGHPALHLCGTAFQLQVWSVLLRIRAGYYVGYGDVARSIGLPRAARAVGRAVGANGVSVLVPCHRVLSADGCLGGYRWGPDLKRRLLEREAAKPFNGQQDLT